MSCYEWEAGTIKLPTAAAPKVRDIVKAAHARHKELVYGTAQTFWKALPASYKKDRAKYDQAVHLFLGGNKEHKFNDKTNSWSEQVADKKLPLWKPFDQDGGLYWDLHTVLYTVTREPDPDSTWGGSRDCPPRRVQQKDVDNVCGRATGANFRLNMGESSLEFKGRELHWSVGENNHARDRGRSHPVARALFKALDLVEWTRGSGGKILGNDEYNRDTDYEGGGGNYVVDEYGPHIKPVRTPAYNYNYNSGFSTVGRRW